MIEGAAIETPLVRLPGTAPREIWLKLECLQPIGSFKLRAAANAIRQAPPESLRDGVWTTSAGNMAQGVAWVARELGIGCTVVAPDHAPRAKLDAIAELGGTVERVPLDVWWESMTTGSYPGLAGRFVHPVLDPLVQAGNGTIGLELLEQLDSFDTVYIPWGGGGLTCGIASALRGRAAGARIVTCEPETGAALAASLAAGAPTTVDYRASFVDGSGARAVLEPMWHLARTLVDDALAISLADTAAAVRRLATHAHVVAEGAGGLALAAALRGDAHGERVVCIVSGGHIDTDRLATILAGGVPQ